MAVPGHVGIVEHDLPATAQLAGAVGLAFHEAIDELAAEILGARTVGKLQTRVADRVVNAVDIERVAHDGMADAITAAGARLVAEQHDLRLRQFDAGGAGGDRGIEVEVFADLFGPRHLDLAERDRDAEARGAVGHAHRLVHLAGDVLAALLGIEHRIDGQKRRLGLHVVDVLRIVDAGVLHRRLHRRRHLLDHGRAADVFRQQLDAHGGADGKPRLRGRTGLAVAREHGGVRRDHAVAAAGPDHRNLADLVLAALAVLEQHLAESLIGEDAGEVVDAAVAFGLADDGDDLIGGELAGLDAVLDAAGVLHRLQLNFRDFDRHPSSLFSHLVIAGLVPAISLSQAPCPPDRDGQVKPGHDG